MKITYIEHSGFMVECECAVLIFDYCKGELQGINDKLPVYVFASHAHHDHFTESIFKWERNYQNITYILSDDIRAKGPVGKTVYISPGQEIKLSGMRIKTLRSTDEGVAFLIYVGGHVIYHAGDLNWWHWVEESDAYNEMMRRNFQYEIGKIEGDKIDVAFLPLDPRQEKEYDWGFRYFMEHTDTHFVFPMHMWGKYETYERLMAEESSKPYRDRVMRITGRNQVFELKG